jgi:hypothetical protein
LVYGRGSAGDGHFVPQAAVEVEVVAEGLAGGGVAGVGVQRVPVVGDLGAAVGSLIVPSLPGMPELAVGVPVTGGQ